MWATCNGLTRRFLKRKIEALNHVRGLGIGGEGGIRTRGGLLTLTRFPGVRLKPLIHLSYAVIVTVDSEGTL